MWYVGSPRQSQLNLLFINCLLPVIQTTATFNNFTSRYGNNLRTKIRKLRSAHSVALRKIYLSFAENNKLTPEMIGLTKPAWRYSYIDYILRKDYYNCHTGSKLL